MKTTIPILICLLGASAIAQVPTAPANARPSGSPASPAVIPRSNSDPSKGIVLYEGWDKRVTGPARKDNHDMADLRAILQDYGEPKDDLDLHRDTLVFPGIPYLTPLRDAVDRLSKQFGSLGIGLEIPIATEGFPLGLSFKKFDKAAANKADFKHLYLLLDKKGQVVSVAFSQVHQPFVEVRPTPLFVLIPGQRFRQNLIDGKVNGNPGVWVWDAKSRGKYVVVHSGPRALGLPDLFDREGKVSYTWYVPEPLINLILYCSQL